MAYNTAEELRQHRVQVCTLRCSHTVPIACSPCPWWQAYCRLLDFTFYSLLYMQEIMCMIGSCEVTAEAIMLCLLECASCDSGAQSWHAAL